MQDEIMTPLLAAVSESQIWTVIGLITMSLIYVTVVRPMMRRKNDPLEKGPAFPSLAQQRSTERQMQNLLVELSEMARQISGQLDTRATRLETLIQQADERIDRLEKASNGQHAPREEEPPPQPEPESPPDPRHAEVYVLADQGREVHEIASELGRPRGEVELILALRGQRD
jgi:hypothetical protein